MKKAKNPHIGGEQQIMFAPDSDWKRLDVLPDLRKHKVIALDRECKDNGLTTGIGPGWAFGSGGGHVCGTSVAWRDGSEIHSAYFPIRHPDSNCFQAETVAVWERDHIKAGVRFVMQNAPYDVGWGDTDLKVEVPPLIDDTTCMAYMVDENRYSYGLDELCKWRGIPGKDDKLLREAVAAYGFAWDGAAQKHAWRLPARFVGGYAEQDAVATLLLRESLLPEIELQDVGKAYQLEMDLLPVVHQMRKRGIRVDMEVAEQTQLLLYKRSQKIFEELSEKMGVTVGMDEVRRTEWMVNAFNKCKLQIPIEEKRKSGVTFDKKITSRIDHWLPQLVIKGKAAFEAAEKFIGTYIMKYAHYRSNDGSRLHASINQFRSEDGGTRTYRFSYSDPPLQQMPNRDDEIAPLIRGIFLPEPGESWLAADYSQQEYRLIVHFAELLGCSRATDAGDKYRNDPRTDFHSMVAEMTGLDRKPAKDANFAKSYGAGISKFALMIRKSEDEAAAIMKQYDEKLPFNSEMNERCRKKAERVGFIRLLDGARIHYDTWEPRWLSKEEKSRGWSSNGLYQMGDCRIEEAKIRIENPDHPWYGKSLKRSLCRKAMNGLIQGSAARQTKAAMRALWREGICPLLQMHDELDFSVATEAQGALACQIMREIVPLRVPMLVDAEYGPTWGKAKYDWAGRAGPPPG